LFFDNSHLRFIARVRRAEDVPRFARAANQVSPSLVRFGNPERPQGRPSFAHSAGGALVRFSRFQDEQGEVPPMMTER